MSNGVSYSWRDCHIIDSQRSPSRTLIRHAPSGDQYVARWPSRTEFVRRETSATSVGSPEPVADLFDRR